MAQQDLTSWLFPLPLNDIYSTMSTNFRLKSECQMKETIFHWRAPVAIIRQRWSLFLFEKRGLKRCMAGPSSGPPIEMLAARKTGDHERNKKETRAPSEEGERAKRTLATFIFLHRASRSFLDLQKLSIGLANSVVANRFYNLLWHTHWPNGHRHRILNRACKLLL